MVAVNRSVVIRPNASTGALDLHLIGPRLMHAPEQERGQARRNNPPARVEYEGIPGKTRLAHSIDRARTRDAAHAIWHSRIVRKVRSAHRLFMPHNRPHFGT